MILIFLPSLILSSMIRQPFVISFIRDGSCAMLISSFRYISIASSPIMSLFLMTLAVTGSILNLFALAKKSALLPYTVHFVSYFVYLAILPPAVVSFFHLEHPGHIFLLFLTCFQDLHFQVNFFFDFS